MTKKQQSKLEAIEREVDATKKKRGRPVGSKKEVIKTKFDDVETGHGGGAGPYTPLTLLKPIQIVVGAKAGSKNKKSVTLSNITDWQKQWDAIPDSKATVEQVKDWSRFKPQSEVEETPTNYWKYTCIAILLGIVIAMILSTL